MTNTKSEPGGGGSGYLVWIQDREFTKTFDLIPNWCIRTQTQLEWTNCAQLTDSIYQF